jgi:hypothetical protein
MYSFVLEYLFLSPTKSKLGCPLPHFEPDLPFHSLDASTDALYDTKIALGQVRA